MDKNTILFRCLQYTLAAAIAMSSTINGAETPATQSTSPKQAITSSQTVAIASTSATAVSTAPAPTPISSLAVSAAAATPAITEAPVQNQQPVVNPPAPQINANGYVLMDANTGIIIAQKNMNQRMEPASLTKLMTLYVASQALHRGQISLDSKVQISEKAWRTGGSRMFLQAGSEVTVRDLINGIIVASGNDACVALAQYIGGNEETFASMMNQAAQQLGMTGTHYMDSTGLPNQQHYSTPYDMALLTRAIINEFPQYYEWYKQKWIAFNGIKQPNRNRLLWRDPTVDGLKTGHTDQAGYCLIASAKRDDMRLITVVMGAPSDTVRADDSQALLNWGFRFYQSHQLFEANKVLATPKVWLGEKSTVPLGLVEPLYVTIPTGAYTQLKPQVVIDQQLRAPIHKGRAYGTLNIMLQDKTLMSKPLIALEDDPEAGFLSRMWDHLLLLFSKA